MILRDCLVRAGIVDSERVCALKPATQLFFRNLLHVCDGAARFEADADRLRTVLYGRSLHVVAKRDVARWMADCHLAGLVRLYTRSGRGYGEVINYGQRDTKRRKLYPGPQDDELNFAAPAPGGDGPRELYPPPPSAEPAPVRKKRSEVKGRESVREAAALPAPNSDQACPETHEAWLARLQVAWPHLDVRAEAVKAYVKKTKRGEQLERGWFEVNWLPKVTQAVTNKALFAPVAAPSSARMGEPGGWREALVGTMLGDAVAAGEIAAWGDLNTSQRAFVHERLAESGRASA
jgi:hypothetical protein